MTDLKFTVKNDDKYKITLPEQKKKDLIIQLKSCKFKLHINFETETLKLYKLKDGETIKVYETEECE